VRAGHTAAGVASADDTATDFASAFDPAFDPPADHAPTEVAAAVATHASVAVHTSGYATFGSAFARGATANSTSRDST
jgi:hypothetical protein